MTATRPPRDPFGGHDPFRLQVFVPAIMSAGLLFSLVTLLRDAIARRGHHRAERRTQLAAQATADAVLAVVTPVAPASTGGLRSRVFYGTVAVVAPLAAVYLVPGALLNYLRPDGYVSDIAWLLGLSLLVAGWLVAIGISAALVVVDWPRPRPEARWLLQATPAHRDPEPAAAAAPATETVPSAWLGAGVLAAVAGLTFVAAGVAVGRFRWFDGEVSEALVSLDLPWIARAIAAIGSTPVSLLLATAIGAVAVRCHTFGAAWVTAVLATFGFDAALKAVVGQARPPGTGMAGLEDSFPSGHLAQIVLLAVAAPLALRVFASPRWLRAVVTAALVVGVVVGGGQRVHSGLHWPTDVFGGVFLGASVGLAMRWVVAHGDWHRRCPGCPWHPTEGAGP